jgi:flagellar hook-associated protein 3 FlgL
MRVTQAEMYRHFLSDMSKINSSLADISRQLSSGKKLNRLADSPAGSADLVAITDQALKIDMYRTNCNTSSFFLKTSESVLNEVNNLVSSMHALGSQAASETISNEARTAIISELGTIREQIMAFANTRVGDRYVFAGSETAAIPFVLEDGVVTYKGDDKVNRVPVDQGVEVQQGVSGNAAFAGIFETIDRMLTSMEENDVSGIKDALGGISPALSALGQARSQIGVNIGLLNNQAAILDAKAITVRERRSTLEDADMLAVTVRLAQLQTALDTTLSSGGAMMRQSTLFDILG